jgi:hypothetical protein
MGSAASKPAQEGRKDWVDEVNWIGGGVLGAHRTVTAHGRKITGNLQLRQTRTRTVECLQTSSTVRTGVKTAQNGRIR